MGEKKPCQEGDFLELSGFFSGSSEKNKREEISFIFEIN